MKLFWQRKRRPKVAIDPLAMSRYYRHANCGDKYLTRYEKARDITGSTDNFPKQNRFFTLAQITAHIATGGVPGDVAECGCWRGHSTYLIADILREYNWGGHFWVFDSFEGGLSEKSSEDRMERGNSSELATLKQKQKFASNYEAVARALSCFPFVSLHKGWIPEVIASAPVHDKKFALVHIDVDLYKPTLASLEFFYPRMMKGGVIIIDDYGSSMFPGAQTAVDEFLQGRTHLLFLENHLMGAVIIMLIE